MTTARSTIKISCRFHIFTRRTTIPHSSKASFRVKGHHALWAIIIHTRKTLRRQSHAYFLTNDDGYEAPGIVAMAKKLVALGRVTVIAPDKGRSSCSSSLSLQTYLRLWYKESYGENITVLACSGTTADCAKLALCTGSRAICRISSSLGSTMATTQEATVFTAGPSAVRSRASCRDTVYCALCGDYKGGGFFRKGIRLCLGCREAIFHREELSRHPESQYAKACKASLLRTAQGETPRPAAL